MPEIILPGKRQKACLVWRAQASFTKVSALNHKFKSGTDSLTLCSPERRKWTIIHSLFEERGRGRERGRFEKGQITVCKDKRLPTSFLLFPEFICYHNAYQNSTLAWELWGEISKAVGDCMNLWQRVRGIEEPKSQREVLPVALLDF